MKALTVSQPWESRIYSGEKWVEYRTRMPPRELIGARIAIHAGKGKQWLSAAELRSYPTSVIRCTVRIVLACHVGMAKQCLSERILPVEFRQAGKTLVDLHAFCAHGHGAHDEAIGIWIDDLQKLWEPVERSGALGYWEAGELVAEPVKRSPRLF